MEFCDMLAQSRFDAGKSQVYMAKHLNVSRTTIVRWENGYSSPYPEQTLKWFRALGIPAMPYLMRWLYDEQITPAADDKQIEETLIKYVRNCTPEERRKLLFLLRGDHGSSPAGLLEMITAHLHTPLASRISACTLIINNYKVHKNMKKLVNENNIQPNMNILEKSYSNAMKAVIDNNSSYTNM